MTISDLGQSADLNHAYFHGEDVDGLEGFLQREATFLTGELWGQKDRRNTQDGDWKAVTMPWMAWIAGGEKTADGPEWGLSRHALGKNKEGAALVLGSSIAGARKAQAMDTMYAMGLDVDSGARLDDVLNRVEDLGLLCLIYTSFNHGKTSIELKRDDVLRKLKLSGDPSVGDVRRYLREHSKDFYEEEFIARVQIEDPKCQTATGVKIVLRSPPLDKFRLIFPLAEPIKIIELAEQHSDALKVWEDKITGLARNVLGIHFDTSCTDPSRLFYTARHPKGAQDWYVGIVKGHPVSFNDIPALKKEAYLKGRGNAFLVAGLEAVGTHREQFYTPSGRSLNEWDRRDGENFQIAELIEIVATHKVRNSNGAILECECPFEGEHSTEGGTAFFVVNALDSTSDKWTAKCHHDACQGRDKLAFLQRMLEEGWFEEEDLFEKDRGFVLEGPDEPDASRFTPEIADPFAPLYDDRLVDESGWLRKPEVAAELYREYGIEIDEKEPKAAYNRMAREIRTQIADAMRSRYSYIVTSDGGRAAIRPTAGMPVEFKREQALDKLYRNRAVSYVSSDKVKQLKPAEIFFYDRLRETFDGTCFEPDLAKAGSAANRRKFNIWTGFAVQPVKGDWSLLRDHVKKVMCGNDENIFNFVMTWVASHFAGPGVKVPSSIAIRGEQGTGKSKFFDWVRRAMGHAAMKVSQGRHLTGNFNAHLDGKLLLVCEEAFWAGDKAAAGVIKDLISAEELTVEAKFENAVTRENRIGIVFISNNTWIIPTDGTDARRFLVLEATTDHKEDAAHFADIDAQMRKGGVEAMVYELTNWDPKKVGLTWESLRTPPETEGLRQQARMGLTGPIAELVRILEEGVLQGRMEDGDVFYYDLKDDTPTRVARKHLTSALGIKKGRGHDSADAYNAIRDLCGEDAIHDNKSMVEYYGEVDEDSRVSKKTMERVRYVDIPALGDLDTILSGYR